MESSPGSSTETDELTSILPPRSIWKTGSVAYGYSGMVNPSAGRARIPVVGQLRAVKVRQRRAAMVGLSGGHPSAHCAIRTRWRRITGGDECDAQTAREPGTRSVRRFGV